MDSFSDDELRAEIRRLGLIENACRDAGELDGATAARSQHRALIELCNERGIDPIHQ